MQFAELFCGAGGMSQGLKEAGLNPAAAYDSWPAALAVYRDNLGPHARRADLAATTAVVRELKRRRPALIAGGPPCQEFSQAGGRREGERAALTIRFAEIVAAVRPTWFLFENVDRARRSTAFAAARRSFLSAGYGLTEQVLDASRCGAPQRRRRFFCLGRLGAPADFLADRLRAGLAAHPMTIHDYLGDRLGIEHYYRHPRTYDRRAVFSIREPAPTIRGTIRQPTSGRPRHPRDGADPLSVRALTREARSLIQTFPEGWVWSGRPGEIDQMIGNSVPPALAAYLGRAILAWEQAASAAAPAIAA